MSQLKKNKTFVIRKACSKYVRRSVTSDWQSGRPKRPYCKVGKTDCPVDSQHLQHWLGAQTRKNSLGTRIAEEIRI